MGRSRRALTLPEPPRSLVIFCVRGVAAPELANQFQQDANAYEQQNKLTGAGVIVGGAKSAMQVLQTVGEIMF
jgi:hypothetical protein